MGDNFVRAPSAALPPLPDPLVGMYRVCDGLVLSDVHVGYFIDPAERVASSSTRGEPVRIKGRNVTSISVFGSDGGGGRFAVNAAAGEVYYLPSGGAVAEGTYFEDERVRVRRLADSLIDFLGLIAADVEAAVTRSDSENHTYLV
jgi:hypothetical protein